MATDQALLRTIVEDPDDDTPRLAYADWLEELGGEEPLTRAEFIRVQISLARLADDDPARPALVVREALLLRRHGDLWGKEIKGLGSDAVFRRGFIEEATVTLPQLLRHGKKLLSRAPISTVRFGGTTHASKIDGQIRELAGCPILCRLRGLDLWALASDGGNKELLHSPLLRGLRKLHLSCYSDEDVGRLAGAHSLEALEQLWLGYSAISNKAAGQLSAAPWFPRLTHLDLGWAQVTPAGVEDFISALPPALEDLAHSNSRHGDAAVRRLVREARNTRLKALLLGRTGVKAEGLAALVQSPIAEGLTWLDLGGNELGVEGGRLIAQAPRLAQLTRLELCGNGPLGDPGARHLAESRYLRRLTWLDLGGNEIGPDGAARLADSVNATGLCHLDLYMNEIGDAGVEALARSPHLRRLNYLGLFEAGIGDRGAAALAASPILGHVTTLDLRENAISLKGAEALAASPHLGEHATLLLPHHFEETEGLRRRFPGRIECG